MVSKTERANNRMFTKRKNEVSESADIDLKWYLEVEKLKKIIQKLPKDKKGGRIFTVEIKNRVLNLLGEKSLSSFGKLIGINESLLYKWKTKQSEFIESDLKPTDKNVAKTARRYTSSEKKAIVEACNKHGCQAVHDANGVSWDTIASVRASNKNETSSKKRRHHNLVIDTWKKHPGMGPMQVRNWIAKHKGLKMGVNTVRKTMESEGWVPPYSKVKREREDTQRFEACRRNALWHTDFKQVYINSCKVFILLIQDDYSRFIVGHSIVESENASSVLDLMEQVLSIHGKPDELMTDGGSAFNSWKGIGEVTKFLEENGIDQYIARTPNVNGKLENLNGQIDKELLLVRDFSSINEFSAALERWITFYNFERVHQGLSKLETPADRFYPGGRDGFSGRSMRESILRLLLAA